MAFPVLRRSLQCVIDQKHKTSSKQGLALSLAWGTIVRGWVLAQQGKEAGIAQMV